MSFEITEKESIKYIDDKITLLSSIADELKEKISSLLNYYSRRILEINLAHDLVYRRDDSPPLPKLDICYYQNLIQDYLGLDVNQYGISNCIIVVIDKDLFETLYDSIFELISTIETIVDGIVDYRQYLKIRNFSSKRYDEVLIELDDEEKFDITKCVVIQQCDIWIERFKNALDYLAEEIFSI